MFRVGTWNSLKMSEAEIYFFDLIYLAFQKSTKPLQTIKTVSHKAGKMGKSENAKI